MAESTCACSCGAPKLVFTCSGAADVGEISDRAAREIACSGLGRMYCLAGIGGRIPDILKTTESSRSILAIDGCPGACASMSLKQAGFTDFEQVQLDRLGLQKGSSPASPENIARVVEAARQLIPSD